MARKVSNGAFTKQDRDANKKKQVDPNRPYNKHKRRDYKKYRGQGR